MKLENQVINIKLAQQLKKLGVKQDAYWSWVFKKDKNKEHYFCLIITDKTNNLSNDRMWSAYATSELLDMLPCGVSLNKGTELYNIHCEQDDTFGSPENKEIKKVEGKCYYSQLTSPADALGVLLVDMKQ